MGVEMERGVQEASTEIAMDGRHRAWRQLEIVAAQRSLLVALSRCDAFAGSATPRQSAQTGIKRGEWFLSGGFIVHGAGYGDGVGVGDGMEYHDLVGVIITQEFDMDVIRNF